MKKVLCMLVFATSLITHSQTNGFDCATPDLVNPDPAGAYSRAIDVNVLKSFAPVVFNVYY
jgi:hypothetical protein